MIAADMTAGIEVVIDTRADAMSHPIIDLPVVAQIEVIAAGDVVETVVEDMTETTAAAVEVVVADHAVGEIHEVVAEILEVVAVVEATLAAVEGTPAVGEVVHVVGDQEAAVEVANLETIIKRQYCNNFSIYHFCARVFYSRSISHTRERTVTTGRHKIIIRRIYYSTITE